MKKKTYFIIVFIFSFINCFSQSIDTLNQFSKVNEELFWKILSKNYPFTYEEIQNYEEDINFYFLSSNERINWSAELIKKYESSLSKTYELQRNKGIHWNESLIKEFLDRDWLEWSELYFNRELTISKQLFEEVRKNFLTTKFIIGESTDSVTFYYNHEYFTKERFFQDYLKHWYKEADSTRVNNYEALKQYFGFKISTVPVDSIIKYHEAFDWYDFTRFAEISWTWKSFIMLYPYLYENNIPKNKSFYNRLLDIKIDSISLAEFYQQSQAKSRLFEILTSDDRYGSVPAIDVGQEGYPYSIELMEEFNFQDSFPETLKNFYFEVGHSAEGPKRFLDIMFLDRGYAFPSFICSKKVKEIVESHILPSHKFYPIELVLDSYWYGKDTLSYYLFVTNNSSLVEYIQPDSIKIKDSRELLIPFDTIDTDSLKFFSSIQFEKFMDPRYHRENYRYKQLAMVDIENYFDLLTIDGTNLYVSKRLKNALTSAKINGVKYSKDYSIDWIFRIPESKDTSVRNDYRYDDDFSLNNQKTTILFDKAKEKQKRLSKTSQSVSTIYKKLEKKTLDTLEIQLIEMETRLDVILPEEYRKYLLTDLKPELGRKFREYDFLPISRIERVGKEWYKNIPQTYKGILIAENGLGDYLGFLLDENSDIKLSNTIYKFEHEIGELIESIKLE